MVLRMAKFKLILTITMILGFMLILVGSVLLLIGAFKNNNDILLIAFIPLGLGILNYIILIILVIIRIKKKD